MEVREMRVVETILALDSGYIRAFVEAAEHIVRGSLGSFRNRPDWNGGSGGYLCIADVATGSPLAITIIGRVPIEKAQKHLFYCQEKAQRLATHPEHETSFESRNPDANQWGGAVRSGSFILSFSGFSEQIDEAVMMGIEFYCYPVPPILKRLNSIAVRNHNIECWGPIARTLTPCSMG